MRIPSVLKDGAVHLLPLRYSSSPSARGSPFDLVIGEDGKSAHLYQFVTETTLFQACAGA
jgi:hypothetical protein